MDYTPTNREKRQATKTATFWCSFCDAAKVHPGEKCSNCGKRDKSKTLKKYEVKK